MSKPTDQPDLSLAQLSIPPASQAYSPNFTEFSPLRTKLTGMRQNIDGVLNSLQDNHSYLSRMARFWKAQSLWVKIVGGILGFGSLLALGVVTAMVDLILLSIMGAAAYLLGWFLLDNHNAMAKSNDNLRQGVASLADFLGTTIEELGEIEGRLRVQIQILTEQNEQFAAKCEEINVQLKERLEMTIKIQASADETAERNSRLTEELQAKFDKAIAELATVKGESSAQIKSLQEICFTLQATLASSVSACLPGKEQEAFRQRITAFLDNPSATLDQVTARICKAEEDLQALNQRHHDLLEAHTSMVKEDRALLAERRELLAQEQYDAKTVRDALSACGLFSPGLKQQHPGLNVIPVSHQQGPLY